MKFALPAWSEFPLAVLVLLSGVSLITVASEHFGSAAADANSQVLGHAPIGLLLLAVIVVPAIEALVWSVAFVEAAGAVFHRAWVGVFLGALGYGVAFHWSADIWVKLVATWLGLISGSMYLHVRNRGRFQAFVHAVGLRWSFVSFGIALARGWL